MNATIIVDWPLFKDNPWVQDFIREREGMARMVLVVPTPNTDDYTWDEHPPGLDNPPVQNGQQMLYPMPEIAWDAVIRNSGNLQNVVFKATALSVIQDASTMEPVIALDPDHAVNEMYRDGGVLITIESL